MSNIYAKIVIYLLFRQRLVWSAAEAVVALPGVVGGHYQEGNVPNEQDGGESPLINVGCFRNSLDERVRHQMELRWRSQGNCRGFAANHRGADGYGKGKIWVF